MILRVLAFALCVTACRVGDPQEPKTPPNSPLPEIDRPKDSDAGAARQGSPRDLVAASEVR